MVAKVAKKSGKKKAGPGRPNSPTDLTHWMGRLGKNVRMARQKRGWSLTDFAEITGMNITFLSKFERGKADATVGDVRMILSKMGEKPEKLIPAFGRISPVVSTIDTTNAEVVAGVLHSAGLPVADLIKALKLN